MQSTAARRLEEYEYSREYRGVRKEEPPKLQVREGKRPQEGISPLRLLLCCVLLVALISLAIYNNIVMVELGDRSEERRVGKECL